MGVDIDDPKFSKRGGSKGKRLKAFLQSTDDKTAARALGALWEYRENFLLRSNQADPLSKSAERYQKLIAKLTNNGDLAKQSNETPAKKPNNSLSEQLQSELTQLHSIPAQERGLAFERWLKRFFDANGLKAHNPFRTHGDQIDGSFQFGNETYLVEAKWTAQLIGVADLHTFHGKIEQRAAWARGLFVSYSGFTTEGIEAFGKGKRVICMDGYDIAETLRHRIPLTAVLDAKVRKAAETGSTFVRVRDLFPGQ